jgi:hypothetical protein
MARRAAVPENFEYTREKLLNQLDQLQIEQVDNKVTTTYCGKTVKKFTVSKKYHNFDIKAFVKEIVPMIDSDIDSYNFRIMGGIQEEKVNKDVYKRAFYLLNSTDESRTLQLNFGLYRQVCNNGLLLPESLLSVNTRHYESPLTTKIEEFSEGLKNVDESYTKQLKQLRELVGKKIPMSLIAKLF